MSEQQNRDNDFEERLLDRLKAFVAERGAAEAHSAAEADASARPRRRHPARLAFAGAAALAAAATVLVFNSGGNNTTKAFAVEPQEGGGVTIRIYGLEDAAGLERALGRAGIPAEVNWLPPGITCAERRLEPSTVKTSMGGRIGGFEASGPAPAMTIGVMSAPQHRTLWRAYKRGDLSETEARESIPNISLDPGSFRRDQSVIISGSPEPFGGNPEGGYRARFQVVEGPVEPCDPVPAPAGSIDAIALPDDAPNSGVPTEAMPGPGEFHYMKTKVVQLQGWEEGGRGTGSSAKPRHFTANLLGPEANAMPALVPTVKEVWTAPDGKTRVRETLGRIEFLSGADQERWENAGSPPPFAYDPAEHDVRRDGSGHPVKEYASRFWRDQPFSNVPKLAKLPIDPEALRLTIERASPGSSPARANSQRGSVTAERLMEILSEPISSPELRAAAFGALAEIPGIELEGTTDAAGRSGDALSWERDRGFGRELVFERRTSRVLSQAEMLFGPPSTEEYGAPAGTAYRETAYLRSGIVDSVGETTGATPPAARRAA